MAIVKAAARLILREHASYGFRGPALCLGVPDVYLTGTELREGVPQYSASGLSDKYVTSIEFLGALGVTDITSLDIQGSALRPDLLHDLNEPIPDDLVGRFNLVIDPGTMEHVFDVKTGLANVVRALQQGGVVVHFVPVYSYNGGYFSINPSVLHDFYEVNEFTDLRSYVVMWDRFRPHAQRTRCYPYGPALEPRHSLSDPDQVRFVPHLLLFARKGDSSAIRVPIQHEHHVVASQRRSLASRLAHIVLPADWVALLSGVVRRRRQLALIRRDSFWI